MGVVYRGEQLDLARQVAFKRLIDASDDTHRERFVREARITAQLEHPGIVPLHFLETGESLGYAMKLVEGKTLRQLMREAAKLHESGEPIDVAHSLPTFLDHFLKICDAVAFAHDRGVLHRDLKPANFMVGKYGEVYVMDWGIARRLGSAPDAPSMSGERSLGGGDLTQVGEIVGSASYMSPEQADARNAELDPRADQYALGLILFELVSLRRAMKGETSVDVYANAARGHKEPLEHISKRGRIAPELRAIVEKATAFSPAERYDSVAALADDVRRYLRGEAVLARPDNLVEKVLRWIGQHRRATLVAILCIVAAAVSTLSWTLYRQAASELAARERGERITALFGDVSAQAHRIDSQLQRLETSLEGLRAAAEWALTGPEPDEHDAPIYFDTDFADAAKRPSDFTDRTAYRWPVSVDHAVVGMAPGLDRDALLPKIRRLSPLRHHIRAMFISVVDDQKTLSEAEQRAFLLERRGPIDYAYVDLPEGVHFVYPGVDALPPGYDVRTAGFYTMSAGKRGKRWGKPYVDSTTDEEGDDLVLPCTQGLWSPTGEFLGVAGVEITVTKLVETGLTLPSRRTLRETLVNQDGEKVIDSGDAGKRFKASGKDEGLTLAPFDIPEIAAAIRAGKEGVREVAHAGRDLVVVFVRLPVLGWTYVVEVEAATLGEGER